MRRLRSMRPDPEISKNSPIPPPIRQRPESPRFASPTAHHHRDAGSRPRNRLNWPNRSIVLWMIFPRLSSHWSGANGRTSRQFTDTDPSCGRTDQARKNSASGEIQWSKDVSRFHPRRPRGGRVKQFLRLACSFHALEIAFFLGGQSSDRQQRVPEVASDAANPGACPSEFPGGQIHEDQIRPRERNGSEPE